MARYGLLVFGATLPLAGCNSAHVAAPDEIASKPTNIKLRPTSFSTAALDEIPYKISAYRTADDGGKLVGYAIEALPIAGGKPVIGRLTIKGTSPFYNIKPVALGILETGNEPKQKVGHDKLPVEVVYSFTPAEAAAFTVTKIDRWPTGFSATLKQTSGPSTINSFDLTVNERAKCATLSLLGKSMELHEYMIDGISFVRDHFDQHSTVYFDEPGRKYKVGDVLKGWIGQSEVEKVEFTGELPYEGTRPIPPQIAGIKPNEDGSRSIVYDPNQTDKTNDS